MIKAMIYDTETTGTDPKVDKVIQDARAEVAFHNGILIMGMADTQYYGSPRAIGYGAMSVHCITEHDISGFPHFTENDVPVCEYLIGQNIDFDWQMVNSPNVKRICTLAIARAVYPDADSHKLGALYLMQQNGSKKAVERLRSAHDAAVDIGLTYDVLCHMHHVFRPDISTMEELWQWSEKCRIPTRWGFGKFKGQPMESADRGYMNWYLRQAETDPYTVSAIQRIISGVR